MKTTNWLCAVGMMGLVACGGTVAGITQKQSDAVSAAVKATCDWYASCGEIASGKKYADRSTCESTETDQWNGRWAVADCDGKINSSSLSACTDAIGKITCGDSIDVFTTVNDQCAESKVCSGK